MEVLIAISLLSVLSVGIMTAMRVGLNAMSKTNSKLMDNRRVAGTQRILEQQIAGLMPLFANCRAGPELPVTKTAYFQGTPDSMRFVSSFSLRGASRGMPQILEFRIIPGDRGRGVRLVVNEVPYTGPLTVGASCFQPVEVGPQSFVLADRLAFCRFAYMEAMPPPVLQRWLPVWILPSWPRGIRVEMAPLEEDAYRLRPVTITAKVNVHRAMDISYADY